MSVSQRVACFSIVGNELGDERGTTDEQLAVGLERVIVERANGARIVSADICQVCSIPATLIVTLVLEDAG